jgi:hypothetical protein
VNRWYVDVDNDLPVKTASSSSCPKYLGYQGIVVDKVQKNWVPILEKAWAKYLNAFRFLSTRPGEIGYGGIRSSRADRVMAAITGGLSARLRTCSSTDTPCVFASGTYEGFANGKYGGDGFSNDEGDVVFLKNSVGRVLGLIQRVRYDNGTVFDNHIRVYDANQARWVHVLTNHAMVIDRSKSLWSTQGKRCSVTPVNPWGYNPVDRAEDLNGVNRLPSRGGIGGASFDLSCEVALGLASALSPHLTGSDLSSSLPSAG